MTQKQFRSQCTAGESRIEHVCDNNRVKQAGGEWNQAYDTFIFTTQAVVTVNKDSRRTDWQKQQ